MAEKMITKEIGGKTYQIPGEDSPIRRMFSEVFDSMPSCTNTEIAGAEFELCLVYPQISKTCVARIIRTSPHLKIHSNLDYIIEFSGELFETMDERTKKLVIEHELLHAVATEGRNGEIKFGLRDHDIKDFLSLIAREGVDWVRGLQDKVVECYASKDGITEKDDPETQREKRNKLKKKQQDLKERFQI